MSDPRDAIDAGLLDAIENLRLVARQIAYGALAGMHRSPRRGSSIEFSEHKVYTPGDDVRHIDWRAFAKTERFHVKQFEDETNLTLELLVDHSGSMEYASDSNPSKLEYARQVAAALAYLALRQADATGLTTFANEVTDELPARSSGSHLLEVLRRLVALDSAGGTSLDRSIEHFANRSRRRSLVVVLTDLLDPSGELFSSFRRLVARRHDVVVVHVMDPAEIKFPFENPSTFASMEDKRRLFVHPRSIRTAYVREMEKFLEGMERTLNEAGVDYVRIQTDEPADEALSLFLRRRETVAA
ncbi:MAG: DUF58 domain-containing protein [Myxococcota bacterium]